MSVDGSSATGQRAAFIVNIDVDDLGRAERFYCEAFGLRIGRRLGEDAVELVGGPTPIYLLAKAAESFATPRRSQKRTYERHWTPVHLDFVVEDIDAAVSRALAAGAVLEAPIHAAQWGRLALMADPFGHGFCLVQFTDAGYDSIVA